MSKATVILMSVMVVVLASCTEDNTVSFGTVEYYPSFLWVDEDIDPVTKTFEFDFSQDAKDYNSFAELQFVDNTEKPISAKEMQVFVDGKQINDNCFRVGSNVAAVEVTFTFSPDAKQGKHQGYLRLINHSLDRIDSQTLTAGQKENVFQWTLYYDRDWNPLAKVFLGIGIGIVVLLLLWFACFKPILYPRFGSIQKTFNVPGMAPLLIKFNGARMVVLATSHPKKQSAWNRFWTGKILYKTHPAFVAPIAFKPSKGHKILSIVQAGSYQVKPNPMPGVGAATIIDIKNNLKINVN